MSLMQHQFLAQTQRYNCPVASRALTLAAGEAGGIIFCANKKTAPTDYLYAYVDKDTSHCLLDKYVASAKTGLIDAAITYGDAKTLIVVRDPSDNKVYMFYDGAQVGTAQTVTDAAVIAGTYHYASGDGTGTFGARRFATGPELLTNGTFDSDLSGWDSTIGWLWDSGHAMHAAAATNSIVKSGVVVVGDLYVSSIDVGGMSAGTINQRVGNSSATTARSANGSYREIVFCAGNTEVLISPLATFDGWVDNLSVKKALLP